MPNKDGTGPLGQGTGTGKRRGSCASKRSSNKDNIPGEIWGRRIGGYSGFQNGGKGQRLNNLNNSTSK